MKMKEFNIRQKCEDLLQIKIQDQVAPAPTVRGFTLVEILVVVGIASIGLMATMAMMTNQAKSQKTATLNSDFQSLIHELTLILADPNNCGITFADPSHVYQTNPALPLPTDFDIPAGQGIFYAQQGSSPGYIVRSRAVLTVSAPDLNQAIATFGSGLQVTKLRVQNWTGVAPTYYANLYIEAQKYPNGAPATSFGSRLMDKTIPFQLMTNSSGKVIGCTTDMTAATTPPSGSGAPSGVGTDGAPS